jgi:peptidoglycan hydrolase CwlO-like protein
VAVVVAAGLVLVAAPAHAARAESAAEAQAAARDAAAEVSALVPQVRKASAAYDRALAGIAGAVSRSVTADQEADSVAAAAAAARRDAGNRVRALYMSGGSTALLASVLDATSASDALRRVGYIQRLVAHSAVAARTSETASSLANDRARDLDNAATQRILTAADVTRRFEQLNATLAAAQKVLTRLSSRARSLHEAEVAAAQLRALNADVDAAAAERVASARAMPVPTDFKRLYVGAARTCSGLSWTVLSAIGQVESGHGSNAATSYAGAQGPMQFLPATFASYAVDGDGDGDTDIQDPADSIFTAAHYLCANGAGRDAASLYRAIWHYNHADWYVQLVLKLAGQLAAGEPSDG